MKTTTFKIEPLSEHTGAEVKGLDLRRISPETAEELRAAWRRYRFLLFRDQELTGDEQIAFGQTFGEIQTSRYEKGFNYVSNVDEDGKNPFGPLGFHFDDSFMARPLRGLMLYALESPPSGAGGETLFANVKLAYDALPAVLRERIEGLTIRHGYPDLSKHTAIPGMDPSPSAPRADHPVAFTHPVTGEKLLFLSRRHADRIVELEPDASLALIEELTSYVHQPERVYAHAWKPNDAIVWDNLALQHGRNDFAREHRRHLRRLEIA